MVKAIKLGKENRLAEARARKIISEIWGRQIYVPTVEEYLTDWLKAEKDNVAPASYLKKDQAVRLLLECLGEQKHQSLESVIEADIVKLRNELLVRGDVLPQSTDWCARPWLNRSVSRKTRG